jgi:4-hydroxy-4-methyl-2-oxoglutarate aldolase
MADPQPLLTVRRDFSRPAPAELAPFAGVPTGWIVDANGRRGALHHSVRPLTKTMSFAGTALTVWSRACDNLAPYAAIVFAQPGDVLVVATDGFETAGVAGDILLGMARNKGVVALVTDGMVRDLPGLDAVGIPVFARGLTPNSPQKDGPGEIGLAVSIGGVAVRSGDLVVGDQDGCVVVARERLAPVAAGLDGVRTKERKMDAAVRGGATQHDWLADVLARRTHYVG